MDSEILTAPIHSYESMATLDGDGVRFAVFFYCCPLRCVYCHNPDTWCIKPKNYVPSDVLFKKVVRYKEYFKNKSDFKKLEKAFQKSVQDNQSIPFVRHHINHYDAQFPIWLAIELFTLVNLKYLYKNIPSKDRKVISRDLNLSPPVLDSWIDSLRILRNHLAHNMRLYNTTFPKIPKFEKHHSVIIKTNRIFIFFQLLKYISQTVENWNITLIKLKHLMECYSQYISNQSLGLPDNWFYLLK